MPLPLQHYLPVPLDLFIHPHSGCLIDGNEHALAAIAARREMPDQILRNLVQAVVIDDELVLSGEVTRDTLLLILI